jgi:hypothetical protein
MNAGGDTVGGRTWQGMKYIVSKNATGINLHKDTGGMLVGRFGQKLNMRIRFARSGRWFGS